MEAGRSSRKQNMLLTLGLWILLCAICLAVMLWTAAGKTIVIAEAGQEQTELLTTTSQKTTHEDPLRFQQESEQTGQLTIPLAKETKAENVIMENRYMEQEVWIYIQDAELEFYREQPLVGDLSMIREGWCEAQKEGVILKLAMTGVFEYDSTLGDGRLNVTFYRPAEVYDQIVIIDPALDSGQSSTDIEDSRKQDVALQVARMVQKQIEEPGIRVYLTRTDNTAPSRDSILQLAKQAGADLFLQIGVSWDAEDPDNYGIRALYNEEYFIPEFGNVQWADQVTRKVTIAASNRALGLFPASEDSILMELDIPAAEICLGYATNTKERALLEQESYQEKIASGIAEAIIEVYTKKNE